MRFGFIIPHNWGLDDPEDVIGIATFAEELGFDSVWVNHHVLHAGFILDRLGDKPYYDSLTVLTYAAALTKKVRLGTTVLVLPYLNPIVLAKSLATLDAMSGGRVTVGVGVGGLQHESDALSANFERRGAYTDESIAIMKELWTADDPQYSGDFYSFSGVKFSPKPVQTPHPPVWIGGQSNPALRRVANLGDGWHPTGLSVGDMGQRLASLKSRMETVGRDIGDITLSIRQELDVLDTKGPDSDSPMIGTPEQLLDTIHGYASIGVSEMILTVGTADVDRIRRVMSAFADRVMPNA